MTYMSFFLILKLCPDFLLYVQRPSTDFYFWASSVFPFFGQKRQWQDLNLRIQRIIDFKSIALDHSATLSSHLLPRTSLSTKLFFLFSPLLICSVYSGFFWCPFSMSFFFYFVASFPVSVVPCFFLLLLDLLLYTSVHSLSFTSILVLFFFDSAFLF